MGMIWALMGPHHAGLSPCLDGGTSLNELHQSTLQLHARFEEFLESQKQKEGVDVASLAHEIREQHKKDVDSSLSQFDNAIQQTFQQMHHHASARDSQLQDFLLTHKTDIRNDIAEQLAGMNDTSASGLNESRQLEHPIHTEIRDALFQLRHEINQNQLRL